jgi:hypothetical protein
MISTPQDPFTAWLAQNAVGLEVLGIVVLVIMMFVFRHVRKS